VSRASPVHIVINHAAKIGAPERHISTYPDVRSIAWVSMMALPSSCSGTGPVMTVVEQQRSELTARVHDGMI
jgi:hypothetical protein